MRSMIKLAITATLVASAAAQPHNHQHRHNHARRHQHGSPVVDKRDLTTVYEQTMATVYELSGKPIDSAQAEAGIASGIYFIAGESTPTYVTPTPSSTAAAASSTTSLGAKFFEQKVKSSKPATTVELLTSSSTSAAAATTTTASSPPPPSSSPDSSSGSSAGVDQDFPDGELSCDTLPTAYGAVAVTQLDLQGWASLLNVGHYTAGVSIDSFSVAVTGGAKTGMFATYDCPRGYDMAQWPETSQGTSGQSIGGLYCGADNKLHLTRANKTKKLCMKGAGGVYIVNKLSDKVSFCKTQYPGDESMVLPTVVGGGATVELYNPVQANAYQWQGKLTSAQYYVNPKGLDKSVACRWDSPSPYQKSAGNWAGINVGTSMNENNVTFLSVFHNKPTSNAALDFNIKITGDVSGSCTYDSSSNSFPDGSNGCTISFKQGGSAYITLYD